MSSTEYHQRKSSGSKDEHSKGSSNDNTDLGQSLAHTFKSADLEEYSSGTTSTVDSRELLDMSPTAEDSKNSSKIFKWIANSPVFKNMKDTRSSKKKKPRPICSSEVNMESSSVTPLFQEFGPISPIPKVTPVDKIDVVLFKVDRIDYANIDEEKIIPTFMISRTCYDVMPTSGKVVVLSLELLVKNAFEALVSNELRAAPLWNSATSSFVGMLTISDFISVLRHYYRNAPEDIKDIESQSIATWRKMNSTQKTVKIDGTDSLAQATRLLIEEEVHRIPVLDEDKKNGEDVLFVLTRKRLLHYIYNNIIEKFGKSIPKTPSFLNQSISQLGVGTFSDIATVTLKTTVIDALDLFMERKVSALPIVDENNAVLDIFAKFDVFALAKEQTYHNLDMTIAEAIDKGKAFNKVHEDVYGCTLSSTLGFVIETFITTRAHRLVVINEEKTPIGMVSLSDILKFIVVQPLAFMEEPSLGAATTDIIEEAPEGAVGGTELDEVFLDAKQRTDDTPDSEDAKTEKSKGNSADSKEESADTKELAE